MFIYPHACFLWSCVHTRTYHLLCAVLIIMSKEIKNLLAWKFENKNKKNIVKLTCYECFLLEDRQAGLKKEKTVSLICSRPVLRLKLQRRPTTYSFLCLITMNVVIILLLLLLFFFVSNYGASDNEVVKFYIKFPLDGNLQIAGYQTSFMLESCEMLSLTWQRLITS